MGLFIIAGLLIILGILFWVLDKKYCEDWMFAAKLIGLAIGGVMLFVLLLKKLLYLLMIHLLCLIYHFLLIT